jgi:hypothetical protein
LERELRAEHFRDALDEGEALAFEEFLRAVLAVVFGEFRFVVEQVERAGRAGHVQVDHAPDLRLEHRRRGQQRRGGIGRHGGPAAEAAAQRGEIERAEPGGAVAQEMPAGAVLERGLAGGGSYWLAVRSEDRG